MNAYRFSDLPALSSVAAMVTLAVFSWFALASGAIISDNHSEANIAAAQADTSSTVYDIPAEAKMTIVVEARRSAT